MSRPGRLYAAIGIYRDNIHLVLPHKYPKVTVPVHGYLEQRRPRPVTQADGDLG